MSLNKYSHDEIEKMSMVDVANLVLLEEQQPMTFKETFDKVSQLKKWDDTQKKLRISQFYTDLNMDGRFITNGSNTWGLKRWYRVDQMSEEFATAQMDEAEEGIVDDVDPELEGLEIDDEYEDNEEYKEFADDDIGEIDDAYEEDNDV